MSYKLITIHIPWSHTTNGWDIDQEYMLESGEWIRVVSKLPGRLYRVYKSKDRLNLPTYVLEEDRN